MKLSLRLKNDFYKIANSAKAVPPINWSEFRNPQIDTDGHSPLEHATFYLGLANELLLTQGDVINIDDQTELFYKKQKDYGPHNIGKSGLLGLLVRMSDKQERMINLIANHDGESENEPLTDTYQDLFNYCIITVMVMSGLWPMDKQFNGWKASLAVLANKRG